MANKITYVWVTREEGSIGDYSVWEDSAEFGYDTRGPWRHRSSDSGCLIWDDIESQSWHNLTGLNLRKGTKRRAKITTLPGGGCEWRWVT